MSDLPSPSAPSGEGGDTPLEAAMYVADAIRQHINIQQIEPQSDSSAPTNSSSSSSSSSSTSFSARLFDPPATTPGLVVGIAAGVVTFGLLTPVRRMLLQAAGKELHMLADLIVTSSQAVASANAAMYTGALTGSQVYLQLFNKVSPTAPSATADAICNEPKILSYLQSHQQQSAYTASSSSGSASASADNSGWDPRVQLGMELQQALKHCQQRNDWKQRSKQEIFTTEQQQQQHQQEEDHSATKMSWWESR